MHVATADAVAVIEAHVMCVDARDEVARCATLGGEIGQFGFAQDDLAGDVEPDGGQGPFGAEHLVGRMRVARDVGLAGRRDVSVGTVEGESATHDDDALDAGYEIEVVHQRDSQIGHAPNRHDRHLAGMLPGDVGDQYMSGSRIGRRKVAIVDVDITEAVVAMDDGRRWAGGQAESTPGAAGHWGIYAIQFLEIAGVARDRLDVRIAENCRYPEDLDFGVAMCEQQGCRVVDTGIGVEDDLLGHAVLSSCAPIIRWPARPRNVLRSIPHTEQA